MKSRIPNQSKLGNAIGNGLLAGLAGTAAMTLSQIIEMKITERKASTMPADAATKALNIKEAKPEEKSKFSNEVHWVYGTQWGIIRGLISLFGLKGPAASAAHFAAIWGTAMIVEPKLDVAKPINEWKPKEIATDGFHHIVYAFAAGLVFDLLTYED